MTSPLKSKLVNTVALEATGLNRFCRPTQGYIRLGFRLPWQCRALALARQTSSWIALPGKSEGGEECKNICARRHRGLPTSPSVAAAATDDEDLMPSGLSRSRVSETPSV